jgi:hypothetical protein
MTISPLPVAGVEPETLREQANNKDVSCGGTGVVAHERADRVAGQSGVMSSLAPSGAFNEQAGMDMGETFHNDGRIVR